MKDYNSYLTKLKWMTATHEFKNMKQKKSNINQKQ